MFAEETGVLLNTDYMFLIELNDLFEFMEVMDLFILSLTLSFLFCLFYKLELKWMALNSGSKINEF